MTINLPFSRLGVVMGDPIYVPREARAAELEIYRKIVEAALNDVTAKAYALAGADMTQGNPSIRCEVALLARRFADPQAPRADLMTRRKMPVVRAEGLEPSRAFAQRIFVPATAFAAPAVRGRVCGLDYPFTLSRRTAAEI